MVLVRVTKTWGPPLRCLMVCCRSQYNDSTNSMYLNVRLLNGYSRVANSCMFRDAPTKRSPRMHFTFFIFWGTRYCIEMDYKLSGDKYTCACTCATHTKNGACYLCRDQPPFFSLVLWTILPHKGNTTSRWSYIFRCILLQAKAQTANALAQHSCTVTHHRRVKLGQQASTLAAKDCRIYDWDVSHTQNYS